MKLNKDGFISIEIVIVAGIILIAGVFCVHQFSSQGRESSIRANGAITEEIDYTKGVRTTGLCNYQLGSKLYKGVIYSPHGEIITEISYSSTGLQKYKDRTLYCERIENKNWWVAY